VGEKLTGTRWIHERGRRDHKECSDPDPFSGRPKAIYDEATAFLPFEEYGNVGYRTLKGDPDLLG